MSDHLARQSSFNAEETFDEHLLDEVCPKLPETDADTITQCQAVDSGVTEDNNPQVQATDTTPVTADTDWRQLNSEVSEIGLGEPSKRSRISNGAAIAKAPPIITKKTFPSRAKPQKDRIPEPEIAEAPRIVAKSTGGIVAKRGRGRPKKKLPEVRPASSSLLNHNETPAGDQGPILLNFCYD